jgi:hypothetical protein
MEGGSYSLHVPSLDVESRALGCSAIVVTINQKAQARAA